MSARAEDRIPIHDASESEWPRVFASLALAFEDDPVSVFLFPDESTRLARLERFYALSVPTMVENGRMISVEGNYGAAIWQAPSPKRPAKLGQLWLLARFFLLLGRQSVAGMRLAEALEHTHPKEPHWYLGILGTAPSHQGRGLGSATMQPVLDVCDEEGILSYLESSKEENVPFYEHHGFEKMEELQVPDGPKLWPMRREPREPRGQLGRSGR